MRERSAEGAADLGSSSGPEDGRKCSQQGPDIMFYHSLGGRTKYFRYSWVRFSCLLSSATSCRFHDT